MEVTYNNESMLLMLTHNKHFFECFTRYKNLQYMVRPFLYDCVSHKYIRMSTHDSIEREYDALRLQFHNYYTDRGMGGILPNVCRIPILHLWK